MANLRQKIELALILLFTLIGFASYHPETGSTAWLQWLTLVILLSLTNLEQLDSPFFSWETP